MFEQQAVKSANRSINQGLGVRVLLGEAVGYAYTEDLCARRHAARCRHRGEDRLAGATRRRRSTSCTTTRRNYYSPAASTLDVPSADKVDLMRRADDAARAYDDSIQRVDIGFDDELKYIAIFTSDGRMTGDVQPLVRFNVSLPLRARRPAPDGALGRRRPHGHGLLRAAHAGGPRPRGGAPGGAAAVAPSKRRPAPSRSCSRRATPASSCTRRSATASRPTSTARRPATTPTASASSWPPSSCTVVDDGTIDDSRGSHQHRRRGQPARLQRR